MFITARDDVVSFMPIAGQLVHAVTKHGRGSGCVQLLCASMQAQKRAGDARIESAAEAVASCSLLVAVLSSSVSARLCRARVVASNSRLRVRARFCARVLAFVRDARLGANALSLT